MSEKEFYSHVDKYRDKKIWKKDNNQWILKDTVANHVDSNDPYVNKLKDNCEFRITTNSEPSVKDNQYLLMGRAYIDSMNYGAQEDQSTGGGMTRRKWKRPSIK